ncbi:MAG: hypothetical protein IJM83_01600 [Firmicutes bacterium]|nr:hypothetical protein [Bacillota bacterium]
MPNSYRYASVREIHEAYLSGQATVTEVVNEFLSLIDKYNPYLHAVIEVNPDARAIAAKLDQTLADLHQQDETITKDPSDPSAILPLLFGIPVLLKDNISTGDKLHTSAGAAALGDLLAPADAPCARNLREAGAVILGKANLSEFANYYTEDNPNGWSARGGQAVNPYEPVPEDLSVFELGKYKQEEHFDPSGSSSGSGVAAAAGLCTVAVGTETSGSILSPSSCNSLIGCKPTAGLVSNEAVIPISPTLDTPGPMARTADDCAILLAALAGLSSEAFSQQYPEEDLSLSGLKFGVILPRKKEERGKWDPTDEEYAIFDAFLEKAEKAGVTLMRGADRGTNNGIMDLMKYEIKGSINAFLEWANKNGKRTRMHSLTDILDYVHAHPECSPYGHTLLEARDKDTSGKMDEPEYFEALHKREEAREKMAAYFDENHLDAIISVDFPGFAPFGGFPAVTLPLGFRADGYPAAAFIYAKPGQDFRLIRIVKALASLQPPIPHPNI